MSAISKRGRWKETQCKVERQQKEIYKKTGSDQQPELEYDSHLNAFKDLQTYAHRLLGVHVCSKCACKAWHAGALVPVAEAAA